MGLLDYYAEQRLKNQTASTTLPPNLTSRFLRSQRNISLYQRKISEGRHHLSREYLPHLHDRILGELSLTNYPESPFSIAGDDRRLSAQIQVQPRECGPVVRSFLAILARLSVQSVVFDVFRTLLNFDMIEASSLVYIVYASNIEPEVYHVAFTLFVSFELGKQLRQKRCASVFMRDEYLMPVFWLACMIVRGAKVSLDAIVELISERKLFGTFDNQAYRRLWPEGKPINTNPRAQAILGPQVGLIGFHLPMGLLERVTVDEVHKEFDAFDEMVQDYEILGAMFFGFTEQELVPVGRSLEQLDLRKRYNDGEDGLELVDGIVYTNFEEALDAALEFCVPS